MAEKVVIIGSGPAGWSAAIYAARAELQPLVFEGAVNEENRLAGTLPLGQLALTTEVENYAGFPHGDMSSYLREAVKDQEEVENLLYGYHKAGVTGPMLMTLSRQQAVNFGAQVVTDDIVEIQLESHPFRLKSRAGQEVEAHSVILATGARANYLGLESEEAYKNRGVSACAVCDGALPRFRNKPVVVIGGGDSAMEEGTFLTKYASRVYIVHRRDKLRASRIMAQRAQENPKIEFVWNSEVLEVLGQEPEGLTGVKVKNTKTDKEHILEATGMFLAIGHTPNTDFLRGKIDLDEKGYVKLQRGDRTFTNIEGVFAAGDVADDYYRQAITAAGTGCRAALDAERWLASKGIE